MISWFTVSLSHNWQLQPARFFLKTGNSHPVPLTTFPAFTVALTLAKAGTL